MYNFNCKSCEQSISVSKEQIGLGFDCPNCAVHGLIPDASGGLVIDQKILPAESGSVKEKTKEDDISDLHPVPALSAEPVESIKHVRQDDTISSEIVATVNAFSKTVSDGGKKASVYAKEHLPKHAEFVKESLILFFQRYKSTCALKAPITENEEKKMLSAGVNSLTDQKLMAWRRSMLFVGLVMLGFTVISILPSYVEQMDELSDLPVVVKFTVLHFPFLMICLALYKAYESYVNWSDLKKSRKLAMFSAITLSSQLLLLAIIPMSKFADIRATNTQEIIFFGATMAGAYSVAFIPVMVGLSMGLMRGCLVARLFHVNEPAFGSMLIIASILTSVLIFLIAGIIVQISGSLLLTLAVFCLIYMVGIHINAGYQLKENVSQENLFLRVAEVEKLTPLLILASIVLSIFGSWDLIKKMDVETLDIIEFIIKTLASFCILTIAFCDMVSSTAANKTTDLN